MNVHHLPCAAALAALAFAPVLASQSTLIVPSDVTATTEGSGSTSYPWNRDSSTPSSNDIRVQYCYDSTNFPVTSPIVISQLRFRADDATTTTSWTGGDYSNCEIRLGDSAVDYAAITDTFDTNWGGASPAPVFSGAVTLQPGSGNGTGVPGPWYVTVTLPTPVLYDPTGGADLLLDILHDGVFTGTTSGAATSDTGTNACSRMYDLTDYQSPTGTTQQGVGLVCEITYNPAAGLYPGFTATPTVGASPLQVQFTDTTYTSDPNGVTLHEWDFDNDGTFDSTAQNPLHTYNTGGLYSVTLRVTDATHGTQSLTRTDFILVDPIAADFTATPLLGTAPLQVQFTDTTTGNPIAWNWDFDSDGNVDSTQQNPQYVYAQAGVYSVTLNVTNGANQDTIVKTDLVTAVGATNNTESPQILEYQFNEPRGTTAANTASTTVAPAHGVLPADGWQADPGRALWQGNDAGYGALGIDSASPYEAIVDSGWAVDINGSHTVMFWARCPNNTASFSYPFGSASGGSARVYYTGSVMSLRDWGPVSFTDSSTDPEGLAGWNHWAIVIDDAAGTAQWYLNGVADGAQSTFTSGTFSLQEGNLLVGGYGTSTSLFTRYFEMDDFRVYSAALTPADLMTAMASENPTTSTFGDGCAGAAGIPQIGASGGAPAVTGNMTFALEASNLEAGRPTAFNLGLDQTGNPALPYDIGSVAPSFSGCIAEVFPELVPINVTNVTGTASAPLAVPADPTLANFHIYVQVVVLGSTQGAVSPALDINFK